MAKASMAGAKLAPVFQRSSLQPDKEIHPKLPTDADDADYAQKQVLQPVSGRKPCCSSWACRLGFFLLALLAILAIVLGIVFGLKATRSVQSSGAVTLQAMPQNQVPQPQTDFSNTPTRCMKHCYDQTYVACQCNDPTCNCPHDQVSVTVNNKDQAPLVDQSVWGWPFSWPFQSWSWRNDDSTSVSELNSVSVTCIALCPPDYAPQQTDCDQLDSACGDDS